MNKKGNTLMSINDTGYYDSNDNENNKTCKLYLSTY